MISPRDGAFSYHQLSPIDQPRETKETNRSQGGFPFHLLNPINTSSNSINTTGAQASETDVSHTNPRTGLDIHSSSGSSLRVSTSNAMQPHFRGSPLKNSSSTIGIFPPNITSIFGGSAVLTPTPTLLSPTSISDFVPFFPTDVYVHQTPAHLRDPSADNNLFQQQQSNNRSTFIYAPQPVNPSKIAPVSFSPSPSQTPPLQNASTTAQHAGTSQGRKTPTTTTTTTAAASGGVPISLGASKGGTEFQPPNSNPRQSAVHMLRQLCGYKLCYRGFWWDLFAAPTHVDAPTDPVQRKQHLTKIVSKSLKLFRQHLFETISKQIEHASKHSIRTAKSGPPPPLSSSLNVSLGQDEETIELKSIFTGCPSHTEIHCNSSSSSSSSSLPLSSPSAPSPSFPNVLNDRIVRLRLWPLLESLPGMSPSSSSSSSSSSSKRSKRGKGQQRTSGQKGRQRSSEKTKEVPQYIPMHDSGSGSADGEMMGNENEIDELGYPNKQFFFFPITSTAIGPDSEANKRLLIGLEQWLNLDFFGELMGILLVNHHSVQVQNPLRPVLLKLLESLPTSSQQNFSQTSLGKCDPAKLYELLNMLARQLMQRRTQQRHSKLFSSKLSDLDTSSASSTSSTSSTSSLNFAERRFRPSSSPSSSSSNPLNTSIDPLSMMVDPFCPPGNEDSKMREQQSTNSQIQIHSHSPHSSQHPTMSVSFGSLSSVASEDSFDVYCGMNASDHEFEEATEDEDMSGADEEMEMIPPVPDGDLASLLRFCIDNVKDFEGIGLFPLLSCYNHSCEPNAFVEFPDGQGKKCVVRASRPIKMGEELSVSYIPLDLNFHERQAELSNFQFRCTCPRCLREQQSRRQHRPDHSRSFSKHPHMPSS